MPINTTYPNQFTGAGRTFSDFGTYIETFQGYAQIPANPIASVPLLDIASPNPSSPVPLTLQASPAVQRSYMSITGVVVSAGSDITLSAAGTIRVASTASALTADAAISAAAPFAAVPRTATGTLVSGTTIPRGTVLFNGGGTGNAGFTNAPLSASAVTYSIFGCTNDSTTATAVNMSSSVPTRPAFILVTIRTMIRGYRTHQISDYPELPRHVRELLQVTV